MKQMCACVFIIMFLQISFLAGEPVKLILDTDMHNDCDDAGALAVLHGLADLGEVEILAITTNRKEPGNSSAGAVDAINTYYGRPDIPIGTDKDGSKWDWSNRPSPYASSLKNNFPNDAKPDSEMPDALTVYRKTLAAQDDHSVVICSVGALSNLEDLARSKADEISQLDGQELIRKKVKYTVIMGGGFPKTKFPETNLRLDVAAAAVVATQWPGKIYWHGFEIGDAIRNGTELQKLPDSNPVKMAYKLIHFGKKPALEAGKPSHDQAAVITAVRGPENELWTMVSDGRVVTDSAGHAYWQKKGKGTPGWWPQHTYMQINGDKQVHARLVGELMSSPPKLKK